MSNSISPWLGHILSKGRDPALLMKECSLVLINNMEPKLRSLPHIQFSECLTDFCHFILKQLSTKIKVCINASSVNH